MMGYFSLVMEAVGAALGWLLAVWTADLDIFGFFSAVLFISAVFRYFIIPFICADEIAEKKKNRSASKKKE